jgi:hypothetical protein
VSQVADRRIPFVVLAVLSVVAAGLIMYAGRQTLFYFDDWDIVLGRRGTSLGTFLDPHEGHFSLVPILVYKALFATVGLEPYWPYRAVTLLFHLIAVWVLFALARPRLGDWGAVVAAALLLFLGWGHEVLLWAWEMGWTIAVAAGLGAWLFLRARTTGRDIAAGVLLFVAMASAGVGVPFALGALVALLIPRAERSRAWAAAVPLALYLLWLVAWGSPHDHSAHGGIHLSNLPDTPLYMVTSAAGAAGGIGGLNLEFGRVLLGLAAVFLVWRLVVGGLSNWLAGALVAATAFWALTGLARADLGIDTANSSRYLYVGAVLILLIAIYVPVSIRPSPMAWALIGLATVFAILGGVAPLRNYGRDLRNISNGVAPALAALQVGGDAVPAGDRPELGLAPQINAGQYREAVAEFGSPLPDGVRGVLANPNAADVVDAKLAAAEGLNLQQPKPGTRPAAPAPAVVKTVGGTARASGGCLRFVPTSIPAALDVRVPPGDTLLTRNLGTTPVEVRVRRFGPDYQATALGTLAAHQSRALGLPRDTSAAPWTARISPAKPVEACLVR